jgi:hypothetical protein
VELLLLDVELLLLDVELLLLDVELLLLDVELLLLDVEPLLLALETDPLLLLLLVPEPPPPVPASPPQPTKARPRAEDTRMAACVKARWCRRKGIGPPERKVEALGKGSGRRPEVEARSPSSPPHWMVELMTSIGVSSWFEICG